MLVVEPSVPVLLALVAKDVVHVEILANVSTAVVKRNRKVVFTFNVSSDVFDVSPVVF